VTIAGRVWTSLSRKPQTGVAFAHAHATRCSHGAEASQNRMRAGTYADHRIFGASRKCPAAPCRAPLLLVEPADIEGGLELQPGFAARGPAQPRRGLAERTEV